MTTLIFAIVIGAAFGVALDRIGATTPGIMLRMLNLKNLHLMKTILLAIGVASTLMFAGQMMGLIEVGHMSVKTAYIGVFIGGLLMGAGWAVAGYCPGTSLSAAAAGRRDAMVFIAGGLLGAAAYMVSYSWVQSTGILDKMFGGKATVAAIPDADYPALFDGMRGDIVGILLGLVFIAVAIFLPNKIVGTSNPQTVPAE
ncbi:MAG: YeeE/YedE family protein [Rhodobacteraceae bacterium]|nr:YeeE/YedE family protein [Paracoccaceae bacterium]